MIDPVKDYYRKMALDGRMIRISKDGYPHTFITFSICHETDLYKGKGIFKYMPHDPYGTICFIEQMASYKWTKQVRIEIEEALVKKYPQIERAVWYRPTKQDDRLVIYRRKHATSL